MIDPALEERRDDQLAIEAEKYVLGATLVSKDAVGDVAEGLTEDDFYRPVHRDIFSEIRKMWEEGVPVDPVTLWQRLSDRGVAVNATYLVDLMAVAIPANVKFHIQIVRAQAAMRRLAEIGQRAVAHGMTGSTADLPSVVECIQGELAALVERTADGGDVPPIGDELLDALDETEAAARRGGQVIGLPTGFADLDALLNGFHPGQMIVVAARPAVGKSTLAGDFARAAAIKHDTPTLMISLEMSRREIINRFLSAEARVNLSRIKAGTLSDEEWQRIAAKSGALADAPLFVDDAPNQAVAEIRAKARRLKNTRGLGLIIVDYLQLMVPERESDSRQQEVAKISRGLKLLAKELEVPVVAVSQLNRGPEQRADKRPQVSDLRDSGAIEQDADIIILIHREDAYDRETPRAGEADLIVAKHRNGPTGTVTVAFQGHYSRFFDMART